jgi:hypothetical protein
MSNAPGTYHVLVTLPDVTGEESDVIVEHLEARARYVAPGATAEHLTPETLPDRYVERPHKVTVWTLNHIADWEGGATIFTDHAELEKQVVSDFQDACERNGEDHITAKLYADDAEPANKSLDSMAAYIQEHGWKVHHYDVEQHEVVLAGEREAVPA